MKLSAMAAVLVLLAVGTLVTWAAFPTKLALAQTAPESETKAEPATDKKVEPAVGPWAVVETKSGVVRLNTVTGHASVLDSSGASTKWVAIVEPPPVSVERERRMRELFAGSHVWTHGTDRDYRVVPSDKLEADLGLIRKDRILAVSGTPVTKDTVIANLISQAWHSDARRAVLRVERDDGEFDLNLPAVR